MQMRNAINLSDTVIKGNRKRISEISSEESVRSYRMNIIPYQLKDFAIIECDRASAVVLDDLRRILEIYFVTIFGVLYLG